MKIIDDYLDNVLYKQLRVINMPYRFIKQIQEDYNSKHKKKPNMVGIDMIQGWGCQYIIAKVK